MIRETRFPWGKLLLLACVVAAGCDPSPAPTAPIVIGNSSEAPKPASEPPAAGSKPGATIPGALEALVAAARARDKWGVAHYLARDCRGEFATFKQMQADDAAWGRFFSVCASMRAVVTRSGTESATVMATVIREEERESFEIRLVLEDGEWKLIEK